MRKWIMLAVFNWLRKPANRQKAKDTWNKYRGNNNAQRAGQDPNRPPNGSGQAPKDVNDRF